MRLSILHPAKVREALHPTPSYNCRVPSYSVGSSDPDRFIRFIPFLSPRSHICLVAMGLSLLAAAVALHGVAPALRCRAPPPPAPLLMSASPRPNWPWRGALAAAVCAGTFVGVPPRAQGEGEVNVVQRVLGARSAVAAPTVARSVNSKRLKLLLKAKLAKVPVFLVTNDGGSPFLSTLSGGDQSALLFLFPSDAERMLAGVMKAPNAASSGPKVSLCPPLPFISRSSLV